MSDLHNSLTEKPLPKSLRFVTHFYSKRDVMRIWGITNYIQFEELIGDEGKQILNWQEGKQRFNPNTVRKLIDYIGAPLTITIN